MKRLHPLIGKNCSCFFFTLVLKVIVCTVFEIFIVLSSGNLQAQPAPGDVFREYIWVMPQNGQNDKFLRVGGQLDYHELEPTIEEGYIENGNLLLPHDIDLKGAVKAEIMAEKVLCHDYTTGLAVSVNNNPFIVFPEAEGIPEPQESYMHHFFPVAQIPLEHLKPGKTNFFELKVDSFQHWNWPQNLIYGIILRVYFNPTLVPSPSVVMHENNTGTIGLQQKIKLTDTEGLDIKKVDYLALYDGLNMEGDGVYRQWHYTWFMGNIGNHVGTTAVSPFIIDWNTEWIPCQDEQISLAARVSLANGLIIFTHPLEKLSFNRNYKVEFCKPYNIPAAWLTRNGEHSSAFFLAGDKNNIEEIIIVWRSWSPGYMNGLYLNDYLIFIREGNRYEYFEHELHITDPEVFSMLNPGFNTLKTGKTPAYNWEMVHGMEMQYPGPMILIKYQPEE